MTRNGIILPIDFLDGAAGKLLPLAPREIMKDLGPGKEYSLAWVMDPLIQHKTGLKTSRMSYSAQRSFALNTTDVSDPKLF